MDVKPRGSVRILLLAACASLALGFLAAAPAAAAYVDGYVTTGPSGDCMMVRDHEGRVYVLEGAGWHGVIGNDYVRLEGRIIPTRRCGVERGFAVSDVSGIWTDEGHRVSTYVRDRDGRFRDWVQRHRMDESHRWDKDRHDERRGDEEHHEPPPPPPHR